MNYWVGNNRYSLPCDTLSHVSSKGNSWCFTDFLLWQLPFLPAWFLDMEDHPSARMIAVTLYPGQTFKKPVQTNIPSIVATVNGHLCAQKGGLKPAREGCCWSNAHCRSTAKKTHLESMWTHLHRLVESLSPSSQALKVWRFWGCVLTPHLGSLASSKSLIDTYCQGGSSQRICLFYRLAVQSHLTQQCRRRLQISTREHRKGFAPSHHG